MFLRKITPEISQNKEKGQVQFVVIKKLKLLNYLRKKSPKETRLTKVYNEAKLKI